MMAKTKKTPIETATIDILATAFAAHRINGGYFKETRRFTEPTPTTFANKELLNYKLHRDNYTPEDFIDFKVTTKDRKVAEESIDWLQRDNTLNIIAGTLSDFMKSVMQYISSEKLGTHSYGVLAVVPKVYFEGSKKKVLKKELKHTFRESKHIGIVREPVIGMLTLNETKFVERFACNVFNGSIEGNLVSFFKNIDQTQVLPKEGTTFKIKGKVKRHGENFITKFPETQLNYVRFKVDNK